VRNDDNVNQAKSYMEEYENNQYQQNRYRVIDDIHYLENNNVLINNDFMPVSWRHVEPVSQRFKFKKKNGSQEYILNI